MFQVVVSSVGKYGEAYVNVTVLQRKCQLSHCMISCQEFSGAPLYFIYLFVIIIYLYIFFK